MGFFDAFLFRVAVRVADLKQKMSNFFHQQFDEKTDGIGILNY
jgi:hypothetical protein